MKLKFKSIKGRTLVYILPLVLGSLFILTLLSYQSSKNLINQEIDIKMDKHLNYVVESIEKNLEKHASIPVNLAKVVEASSDSISKEKYADILKNVITSNNDTLGAGVWYEPYKYNNGLKYFGPYAYKDKNTVVYTEDYSTEEYNYPNQDWYKTAVNSNNSVTWIDPYYDETTKVTMVTTTVPFFDKNKNLLGTTTGDIDITNLQKMVNEIKVGKMGKAILLDKNGFYMAGIDSSKVMKIKVGEDKDSGLMSIASQLLSGKAGNSEYTSAKGKNKIFYTSIPSTKWVVALTIPNEELYAPLNTLLWKLAGVGVLAVLLVIAAVLFFTRYISTTLREANILSSLIANGDLSKTINVNTEDEIGTMCLNLNNMSDKLKDVLKNVSESLENVVATSEELTASSEQTQEASEKIAISMQEIALGSDEQFSESENAVKVVEEISSKISNITDDILLASSASFTAAETAENGESAINKVKNQIASIDEKVTQSSNIVNNLGEKSNSIGEIVSLITSIATQTNLLALNAAIEAARAGEQGKGFAVVADEVRKLAEQSGNAAEQIGVLITEIQAEITNAIKVMSEGTSSVREGIIIVDDAKHSFENINKAVDEVSDKMKNVSSVIEEINSSTKGMVQAIEKISKISQESTGNTQNVAAASEEQSALMKEVSSAAEGLSDMAMELQQSISFFKF